jgi:hypothetical protein
MGEAMTEPLFPARNERCEDVEPGEGAEHAPQESPRGLRLEDDGDARGRHRLGAEPRHRSLAGLPAHAIRRGEILKVPLPVREGSDPLLVPVHRDRGAREPELGVAEGLVGNERVREVGLPHDVAGARGLRGLHLVHEERVVLQRLRERDQLLRRDLVRVRILDLEIALRREGLVRELVLGARRRLRGERDGPDHQLVEHGAVQVRRVDEAHLLVAEDPETESRDGGLLEQLHLALAIADLDEPDELEIDLRLGGAGALRHRADVVQDFFGTGCGHVKSLCLRP